MASKTQARLASPIISLAQLVRSTLICRKRRGNAGLKMTFGIMFGLSRLACKGPFLLRFGPLRTDEFSR